MDFSPEITDVLHDDDDDDDDGAARSIHPSIHPSTDQKVCMFGDNKMIHTTSNIQEACVSLVVHADLSIVQLGCDGTVVVYRRTALESDGNL